jgi:uncharacterized protein YecE (DUF72 family)
MPRQYPVLREPGRTTGAAPDLPVDAAAMIHVGTSGWSYAHWDGVLYPPGLPPRRRLEYYLARYRTVELNASYYRWPADSAFVSWRRRLPDGFVMAVKAPRHLTHQRRLYGPERWIARIHEGLSRLAPRRAVLLVQLSPAFEIDLPRLDYFLGRLPDEIRTAVEMRHASWHREETFSLLERHGAAYCVMSGARLPCILRATADFVYVRLHGPDPEALYGGSYTDDDLRWWRDRLREWERQGREAFVYFNNDGGGNAVRNADRLRELLAE